jgi:hypothetical protein
MRGGLAARRLFALASVSFAACAPPGSSGLRARPSAAELRGYHYSDNSGLTVATLAGNVEQPLSQDFTATLRGVADHIVIARTIVEVPPALLGNQATGHVDTRPDVVTSASSAVVGGEGSDKWRFEGTPGLRWQGDVAGAPSTAAVQFRISHEPDYASKLVLLRAATSLFDENTTVGVFGGYGWDRVSPPLPPPGQEEAWPADHDRFIGGASISQLLSPALIVAMGGSFTRQRGTLSNPYRRATVRTSLFPEVLPDARDRFTAFVGSAFYLGWHAALHDRIGIYTDSWGVQSIIPEVALTKEVGHNVLLDLHYRYYKQSAADFYEPVYPDLAPILAGDMRLGRVHDHTFGAEFQWQVLGDRGGFGALAAVARLDLSLLRYEQLPTDMILAKVIHFALLGSL